jgi:hypothetical protein
VKLGWWVADVLLCPASQLPNFLTFRNLHILKLTLCAEKYGFPKMSCIHLYCVIQNSLLPLKFLYASCIHLCSPHPALATADLLTTSRFLSSLECSTARSIQTVCRLLRLTSFTQQHVAKVPLCLFIRFYWHPLYGYTSLFIHLASEVLLISSYSFWQLWIKMLWTFSCSFFVWTQVFRLIE